MTSVVLNGSELRNLLESETGGVGRDLVRRTGRVLAKARVDCPVDKGDLRGSLASEIIQTPQGLVGRVGTNLKYGRLVNDGTRFMRAQPFLTNSLQAAQD